MDNNATLDSNHTISVSKQHCIVDLASGFPTTVSSRFQYVKKLGRGGHGLVYLAFDQQLQRYVALKFFLNALSQNLKKLFEEARTQAQINNKAICQIFEVIESERGLILVLEYIQGETLHSCFNQYDQHALIRLMHSLATALHEAHQKGVIHRDIKPLNIMVTDSGPNASPVLLDFGLAISDWITTQESINKDSGSINFKAPEQSSNSSFSLDNRADIYSLAASFYYCFTSGVPYQESEKPNNDNIALTSHLPADIRLILQKCLHRDPQHRYATAKALADDLASFLECDPVSVRQGTGYRLSRKFFKHKGKALVVLMGITLSATAFIYNYFSSQILVEKAQAQISYANEINALESTAQLTFMSPLHNIERVKSGWLDKIKQINTQIGSHHPDMASPAYYAIGRIYLELQDYQKALSSLQQAHKADPSSETAFYLAIAYGEVLNQQLLLLKNINNADSRHIKIEALYKAYREPAVSLLKNHVNDLPHTAYTNALLAYYQDQPEQASQMIQQADTLPKWFYRDEILRGDIALKQAQKAFDTGMLDNAETRIKQVETAYLQAIEIAPSDPSNRLRLLSSQFLKLRITIQQGKSVGEEFMDSVTRQFEQMNVIDSKLYESNLMYGQLAHYYAKHLQYSNGEPLQWFSLAKTNLEYAASNYSSSDIYLSLASLYIDQLAFLNESGIETKPMVQLAISALLKISPTYRDYNYFSELANLYRTKAETATSEVAKINYQLSIDNYRKASTISPEQVGSQINMASAMYEMVENDSPEAKQKILNDAANILLEVIERSPKHFVANYYLTVFFTELMEMEVYYDINIDLPANTVAKQLRKLIAINASHPYVRDLSLRIKQYNLEKSFDNTAQWHNKMQSYIHERNSLYLGSPNNPVLSRNYVASLCNYLGVRQVLNLPLAPILDQYKQSITHSSEFKDKYAYKALLVIFENSASYNDQLAREVEQLLDKNSPSYVRDWASSLSMYMSGRLQFSQFKQQIELNTGLLPAYKHQLISYFKNRSVPGIT